MAEKSKVTRIKAADDTPKQASARTKVAKPAKVVSSEDGKKNVFVRIGGYFKGAWTELKQVRWPSRKATWGLTLAVLIFSGVLLALIVSLDLLFKYLFELILA